MTINYSKQAIKFLNKQDKPTKLRIINAINKLPSGDVKRLQGKDGYRLRVGDYRIIFDKDFNLIVGFRIREVRESFQMTQAQFSEMCDISESFLVGVENGKKSITSKTLYKICTSTNVSADYFIHVGNYPLPNIFIL